MANDILSRIESIVDLFISISFEAVAILAHTSFVFPCLLDIVYIVSSNSSCGVTILMLYALVDLYVTDFLKETDILSGSFTSE